jgi:hypothetical protein
MVEGNKQSKRRREGRKSTSDMAYIIERIAVDSTHLCKEKLPRQEAPKQLWRKPTGDKLKINSDGAFSASLGEGGWGYVMRDNTGDVIQAGAGKIAHTRDALQAEIVALSPGS